MRLFNFQLKINKRENQVICEAVDEGGVDVTTDFISDLSALDRKPLSVALVR